MVRKLIKYDFRSFFRLIFPAQLILLGIAAINRIIQLFEDTDSVQYNTVFISSTVLYVLSIIVLFVLTLIVALVRFYQGMYSNEGYLSHTLPVTPAQHIWSKVLTTLLFDIGSTVTVWLSLIVITFGEVNAELFKAAGYLAKKFFEIYTIHGALYILEALLADLAYTFFVILLFYLCISIGQMAKKKKILLSVGVFFGFYILSQIIGTIIIIVFTTMDYTVLEQISKWIDAHTIQFIHMMLSGALVLFGILSLVFFFVNRAIMTKKLNLT